MVHTQAEGTFTGLVQEGEMILVHCHTSRVMEEVARRFSETQRII